MSNSPNESSLVTENQAASPRAVEVVGMLGDTVVSVKHLEPAQKVRSRRPAHALLGAGALLLVVAAVAFARAVGVAAVNNEALRIWTDVQNLPAHEFRPQRLSWVYDYLAFGGFAGGLLALGFGLARLRSRVGQTVFNVGRDSASDFTTEHAPAQAFPLVEQREHGAVVTIPEEMDGDVSKSGIALPLAAMIRSGSARPSPIHPEAWEVDLPADGDVRVAVGPTSLLVRSVPRCAATIAGPNRFDARAARFFGASALAHIALVAMMSTIPVTPQTLALDAGSGEGRIVHVMTKGRENPVAPDTHLGDGTRGTQAGVARMPGGAATPDSDGAPGQTKIKRTGENDTLARARAMDRAREVGVVGVLKRNTQLFADIRSMSQFSSGPDAYDYYGDGNPDGSSWTSFGDSPWAKWPGPGGPGNGIIMSDNYSTIPTDDLPWANDGGPGKQKARTSRVPPPRLSDPTVTGGLDKALVRRHIKRQLPGSTSRCTAPWSPTSSSTARVWCCRRVRAASATPRSSRAWPPSSNASSSRSRRTAARSRSSTRSTSGRAVSSPPDWRCGRSPVRPAVFIFGCGLYWRQ